MQIADGRWYLEAFAVLDYKIDSFKWLTPFIYERQIRKYSCVGVDVINIFEFWYITNHK